MNILVICQYYYPEPVRITDICEALVDKGHNVTVITGTPNYPMGYIYEGYENGKRRYEVINGVCVHRCGIIPRRKNNFCRVLNYFSFPITSSKHIKRIESNYDVILINQLSPVMMAEAGIKYKKKFGKKLVIYCLDLWPESLCVGGIKKNSVIYKIFKYISGRIYKNADNILITSRMFKEYLSEMFGIEENKINYLPQYAEDQFINLEKKQHTDSFNLLFAGNIGTAQSIDTILGAADLLKNENIVFHIVGDGKELESLKKKACGKPNVIFYGRKPIEEMNKYYQMADAMLVTLIKNEIISLTLPGKVQSYMAAGKAIIGAINGETAIVLNESQGGYCGEAENSQILADNILKLMKFGNTNKLGEKNKEYYLNNFCKDNFIQKLIEYLS